MTDGIGDADGDGDDGNYCYEIGDGGDDDDDAENDNLTWMSASLMVANDEIGNGVKIQSWSFGFGRTLHHHPLCQFLGTVLGSQVVRNTSSQETLLQS